MDMENKEEEKELEEGDKKDKNLKMKGHNKSNPAEGKKEGPVLRCQTPRPTEETCAHYPAPPDQAEGQGRSRQRPSSTRGSSSMDTFHEDEDQCLG